ncbi:hypothetical protein B0H19DRAFT_1265148 [Mycena capillaripes]|nr:hypothetical protein B0H19DRAFT_1265148 [Mycena capillaripes]
MITIFGLSYETVKIFSLPRTPHLSVVHRPFSRVRQKMYALATTLLVGAVSEMGVYGYVPREVSTPTESALPPTATAMFSFNKISEMTTCTSTTITWIYVPITDAVSDAMDLTLTITNDLPGNNVPDLFQSLSDGSLDPRAGSYIWSSVNVTEGWYSLVANFTPGVAASEDSLPFYVVNGTDTSCLGILAGSPAASSPTASPTSSVGPTSSSAPTRASDTVSSKMNREALVGGVIGGTALLAAVIAAYCCFCYRCASTRGRGTRKWHGFGSATPKRRAYLHTNSQFVRGHSFDSFGRIFPDDGYILDIGRTSAGEEEVKEKAESISSFFPTEELHTWPMQSAFLDAKYSDIDQLSPLPSPPSSHPNSQYSAGSSSLNTESHFSHDLHTAIAYSRSSYPPSPLPAFPSGTSFGMGVCTPNTGTPRGSAGEHSLTGARRVRVPRKPVPQYDSADPVLTPPSSAVAPLMPGLSLEKVQNSQETGFNALGKPLHYLVPDMPPPAAH